MNIISIGIDKKHISSLEKIYTSVRNQNSSLDLCLAINQEKPDLILIDEKYTQDEQFSLINAIRKNTENHKIPIFLLSNEEYHDKLDLIMKYNISKIIAKNSNMYNQLILEINTINKEDTIKKILLDNNLYWLPESQYILKGSEIINLTNNESKLLSIFVDNKNNSLSNERIFDTMFIDNDKYYNDFTIRNLIKNIRKKTGIKTIISIYGLGYKLTL